MIIGGGFTGAATAIHLSRHAETPLDIRIVEPRATPGSGLAHSTPHPDHRLNGTPGIHALYLEDPLNFATWMTESGALAADPQATSPAGTVFARRCDFGRYMAGELARHGSANPSGSRIDHVASKALWVERRAGHLTVTLGDGRHLEADRLILALGWNDIAVPAPLTAVQDSPAWLGSPWDFDRIAAIPRHAPVLLIGSGLTASDTFATLMAQGHQGPVTALSRRGLRPASQNMFRFKVSVWERLMDPDPAFIGRHGPPQTVVGALRALRNDIASIDPSGASWHVPFDELRDSANRFWPSFSSAEKRRFMRHLKSWYDAFRFRNPPQTQAIADAGVRRGQLDFLAGRLQAARAVGPMLAIDLNERGSGARRTLQVAAAINCTGPQPRPSASANPLWQSLIADGFARDHASGLGVDVDTACRVLDARGHAQDDVVALGPPTAGCFGEVAAVPYIARQIFDATDRMQGRWASAA